MPCSETMPKAKDKRREGFLTKDDRDAIRLGIAALKDMAEQWSEVPFAGKAGIVYRLHAAKTLRQLLKRDRAS